jgi:aryl-alcohol dehydrogenase-like predicted oxidoreductase
MLQVDTEINPGINMINLAESYSKGESEREVYVCIYVHTNNELMIFSGRVIEELGIRRSDLILTSKIFFGQSDRKGPNDKGLSRKQFVFHLNRKSYLI